MHLDLTDEPTATLLYGWTHCREPIAIPSRRASGPQRRSATRSGRRRCVNRCWNDGGFSEPVVGAVVARPGYGGIVLGPHASLSFDLQPVSRKRAELGRAWPLGPAVETGGPARRRCPRARRLLRPLDRRIRRPDRYSRARPVRTLQRIRRRRSCDPELVDDKGDHTRVPAGPTVRIRLSPAQGLVRTFPSGRRPAESPDQWRQGWIGSCGPWPIHSQPSLPPSSMISG